jgi:hypothetical protein
MTRAEAQAIISALVKLRETATDEQALAATILYPAWRPGVEYAAGYRVQRNGKLWRVVQAHTSQDGWEPEKAASLWEQINETHAGTLADPIPYEGNMELSEGLYYSQGGVVYRCTRSTGQPVYHDLSALVGLYVEVVT